MWQVRARQWLRELSGTRGFSMWPQVVFFVLCWPLSSTLETLGLHRCFGTWNSLAFRVALVRWVAPRNRILCLIWNKGISWRLKASPEAANWSREAALCLGRARGSQQKAEWLLDSMQISAEGWVVVGLNADLQEHENLSWGQLIDM